MNIQLKHHKHNGKLYDYIVWYAEDNDIVIVKRTNDVATAQRYVSKYSHKRANMHYIGDCYY